TRINSVRSTRKITSAMKMVAGAKLRRAQERAMAARPYAERIERVLGSVAASIAGAGLAPKLLAGTGSGKTHLIIVATADRWLCGGFNSSTVRGARAFIRQLQGEGKTIQILCIGRKGSEQLRRDYGRYMIDTVENVGRRLGFAVADQIALRIVQMFERGE